MMRSEFQCLPQITSLQHHRPRFQLFEQQGKTIPEKGMVISQNNLYFDTP